MRTHLECRSSELRRPLPEGKIGGEAPARLIADALPDHGFTVSATHAEDWGWRIQLVNDAFPLWIGCGHYEEYPDGLLCFIEPSRPFIRRWLRKIDTRPRTEMLASVLEAILERSGLARDLRWWTEEETARG